MKQFLTIFVLLVLASCNGGRQAENKPVLTVSIEPLRFFTEALAGDKYNVVSMVPAGSNPETYDPTPQQMVQLAKSRAYFSVSDTSASSRLGWTGLRQTSPTCLYSTHPKA